MEKIILHSILFSGALGLLWEIPKLSSGSFSRAAIRRSSYDIQGKKIVFCFDNLIFIPIGLFSLINVNHSNNIVQNKTIKLVVFIFEKTIIMLSRLLDEWKIGKWRKILKLVHELSFIFVPLNLILTQIFSKWKSNK